MFTIISFLNELTFNQDFHCEYDIIPIDKKERFIEFDEKSLYSIMTENKIKDKINHEKERESDVQSINEFAKKENTSLSYFLTDDPEINTESQRKFLLLI